MERRWIVADVVVVADAVVVAAADVVVVVVVVHNAGAQNVEVAARAAVG